MALVSVVIPTYNRAGYLCRAIDSVLNQTFSDYEIIVVDDGSTDGTKEMLRPYMARIRYVAQENAGVSVARNRGIRLAEGEWVAFLDSDDWWLPQKLQRQLRCVEETGADVCFVRTQRCDNDEHARRALAERGGAAPVNRLFRDSVRLILLDSGGLYVQSMLIRRELLTRAGCFDESLTVAEDTRLIYDLAFLTPFAFVDEPLVCLERAEERGGLVNQSIETARRLCDTHVVILREACARYEGDDKLVRAALRGRLSHALSRGAELACADRDYSLARALARDAVRYRGMCRAVLRSLVVLSLPRLMGHRCRRKYASR